MTEWIRGRGQKLMFLFGLLLCTLYVAWVHPQGWGRLGYGEDLGGYELSRQIMADSFRDHGRPTFFTERMMAPFGVPSVYYSWSLERDGVGALFWLINPDFPWLWVYFCLSILGIFFGLYFILRQLDSKWVGLGLFAAFVAVFNIPRHYKIFHHYEHIIHHWLVLGIFLDVLILNQFYRNRVLVLSRELWRFLLMQLCFNLGGYYWSLGIVAFVFPRIPMAWALWRERVQVRLKWSGGATSEGPVLSGWTVFIEKRALLLPLGLIFALGVIQLFWFVPLYLEMRNLTPIPSVAGWRTKFNLLIRPLWLDWPARWAGPKVFQFLEKNQSVPIDLIETATTLGWLYWIPIGVAFRALWKTRKTATSLLWNQGRVWLGLLLFLMCYGLGIGTEIFQQIIPTMKYFRVSSRVGLMMPYVAAALLWVWREEIASAARRIWKEKRNWAILFLISSVFELAVILVPFAQMPAASDDFREAMNQVRERPGTTVLDLPFCNVGGNGICGEEQCPFYPASTGALSLTTFHQKKVHGVYLARLTPEQCFYRGVPYSGWFAAWRAGECFQEADFFALCQYLKDRKEISSVLIYPDVWKAIRSPSCEEKIHRYLGQPTRKTEFVHQVGRDLSQLESSEIWVFPPQCVATPQKSDPR